MWRELDSSVQTQWLTRRMGAQFWAYAFRGKPGNTSVFEKRNFYD